MQILHKEQMLLIEGGLSISGTLINSFSSLIKSLMDVGRSFGTAIRRVSNGKLCAF
jgi:hypothetical protein